MLPPTVRTEASPDEVGAVRRLLDRIQAADPDRSPSPALLPALERAPAKRRLATAAIRRPTDQAEIGAWAQAWKDGARWHLAAVYDPDDEADVVALGAALLHPVLALVGEAGGGPVEWWVRRSGDHDLQLAERLGFDLDREVVQLRRPLPLELDGESLTTVAVRPFRPGEDDEAWLAVNAAAFADHPDQGAVDKDRLRALRRERWFDPAGFLVHEGADGHLDGFCWTRVHAAATSPLSVAETRPPLGEIFVIGVDPAAAGLGLGRDLVVAGLQHLADRGLGTAMLWTEHDNEVARHLYEDRLGFVLHHVDRLHTAEVAPAGA